MKFCRLVFKNCSYTPRKSQFKNSKICKKMTFFHILKKFSRIVSLFNINLLFLKHVDKYSCPSHVERNILTYILIFSLNLSLWYKWMSMWNINTDSGACASGLPKVFRTERYHLEWRCGPKYEVVGYGRWPATNCSFREHDGLEDLNALHGITVSEWVNRANQGDWVTDL